jgi:predicted Zn finger-like uncharacterized protein
MRIACSRCQTLYDIPDEKLHGRAVKVHCSQCGHLFVVRKRDSEPDEFEPTPGDDEAVGDFEFTDTGELGFAEPPRSEPEPFSEEPAGLSDEDLHSLGELDLGDFEGLDEDLDLGEAELDDDEPAPPAEELVERVREEELVSIRTRDVQLQGLADDMPRLDIQRGPRRSEDGATRSPLVARDRRRSPLFWTVLVAALATLAFTGYNLYRHPDKALSFLNPSQIRNLWQKHTIEAQLGKEDLQGYYKDLPAGRRLFVIRGKVVNRSSGPQSLILVEGNLFDTDGRNVASQAVFCGNVLSDAELATLPAETIEARLQNKVGEGFSNIDIAPGARVPFMVVFPTPPAGVEKFNVTVKAAQAGSSS